MDTKDAEGKGTQIDKIVFKMPNTSYQPKDVKYMKEGEF